ELQTQRRKFFADKGFQDFLHDPNGLIENKKSAGRPSPTLRCHFRNVSRLPLRIPLGRYSVKPPPLYMQATCRWGSPALCENSTPLSQRVHSPLAVQRATPRSRACSASNARRSTWRERFV